MFTASIGVERIESLKERHTAWCWLKKKSLRKQIFINGLKNVKLTQEETLFLETYYF